MEVETDEGKMRCKGLQLVLYFFESSGFFFFLVVCFYNFVKLSCMGQIDVVLKTTDDVSHQNTSPAMVYR